MVFSRPFISRSSQILVSNRTFAISRFPTRTTGVGRKPRRRIPSSSKPPDPAVVEPKQEIVREESQLWKTIQRSPAPLNSPEDGLKKLLRNDVLVIERQIEMLNIFVGLEQSNKYSISDEAGEPMGYIAEEPGGMWAIMSRQAFATHRPFRAVIMDLEGSPLLLIRRPFAWINSRMFVQRLKELGEHTPDNEPTLDTFGEVQQIWHPWRRRYDLFLQRDKHRILSTTSQPQPEPEPSTFSQFTKVDEGFLAWSFRAYNAHAQEVAHISRAFRGLGREVFTDTGRYYVRFGPRESEPTVQTQTVPTLTLDERALVLSLAVNIDFDYFSRHSGSGGLFSFSHWD